MQTNVETPDSTILDNETIISEIVITVVKIFVICLGSFIQLKIILTCLNAKDTITRQIDITQAVAITIFVFFTNLFEPITDHIPDLHEKVGDWICHIAAFIYLFTVYVCLFHSFVVALMKYIFIVHHMKNRAFGERKTQKIFFLATIIHPAILAILTTLAYDFESSKPLISCYGLKEQVLMKYNTSTRFEKAFLCKLGNMGTDKDDMPWFYIRQGFCATKMIWVLLLSTNIPEGYLYFKIFKKMRR